MSKTLPAPFFSIIIPTLNEEVCLPRLLGDLAKQTCTDFEVVHVDAHSEDQTQKKALAFAHKLPLTVINSKQRNVAAQRNLGGEKARGRWIIFMDADNRLADYFLQGIKYRIERGRDEKKLYFDVFTTLMHLTPEDKRDSINKTTINFLNVVIKAAENTDKPAVFGALLGMKAEVFRQVKFRTEAKVLEDVMLVEDVKRRGFKYRVLSDPTYAYSLRRLRSKGLGKTAMTSLRINFLRLLGEDFSEKDYGYQMLGGEEYDYIEPTK